MKQLPRPRRTFLFLQGPHGSFFPRIGEAIELSGHAVRRINFNGGDYATWPKGNNYRGSDAGWPRYLESYLAQHAVTDLVLFGDSRPQHIVAIKAARIAGIRVHVFEEGYVRPDWVTLERNGVNGHSTLPKDPEWYVAQARDLPPVPVHPPIPSYATSRGWAAFFYYAEVVLQHWRFPFHGSHRNRNPVWEGISFLRRFRRHEDEQRRVASELAQLGTTPYFLFPLQLDSDYQIRVHSRFGGIEPAIRSVLESFATHAPQETKLVVKQHPLDSGLRDWRGILGEIADGLGLARRVVFLDQGDLSASEASTIAERSP